jgi:hypothetical protein
LTRRGVTGIEIIQNKQERSAKKERIRHVKRTVTANGKENIGTGKTWDEVKSGEATALSVISSNYRPIFFNLLDTAIAQLTERFSSDGLAKYKKLENVLLTSEVPEENQDLLRQYPELNVPDLVVQLRMFSRTRQITSVESAVAVLRDMLPEVRAEYDQICQLVRLLMVSPASSAQAERSFSALRRLKTWLRTTMSEVRLNSVAVCHTHQDLIDRLEIKPLMAEYISRSDIRRSLFGSNNMD